MSEFIVITNHWGWVFGAIAIWVSSYIWMKRIGTKSISDSVDEILGVIPVFAFAAVALAAWAEWDRNGKGPLFVVLLITALVLLLWKAGASALSVQPFWREFFSSITQFKGAALAFTAGVLGLAAGILGVWAGYQWAFGDEIAGLGWAGGAVGAVVGYAIVERIRPSSQRRDTSSGS